jgi:hypothetical protein
VDLGDGRALAVDPSRDLRGLRAAADRHRLTVSYVVFVAGPGQELDELDWQSLKIGYEHLAGLLDGGVAAWAEASGQPLEVDP